jgi:hypothetical protein
MLLGLFGLTLNMAACPSDDAEGTATDGETEGTSTGAMTMTTSPSTSTTTPATTTDTTTEPTTEPTTDVTSDATTDTDTATGTEGTTMAEDLCTPCVTDNCGDQAGVCLGIKDCACWLECTSMMNDEATCMKECGPPPMEFGDFLECVATECSEECLGGGTGTGTTGGDDGVYSPCEMGNMCPGDLECNDVLQICTFGCEGDVENCPDPADGDATPACSMISDTCILTCADGEMCPAGTDCQDFGGGNSICTGN